MQERREPLILILPTCVLPNMQIESLSQSQSEDHPTGEFYATLGFKQITVEKAKQITTGIKSGKADLDGDVDMSVLYKWLNDWRGDGTLVASKTKQEKKETVKPTNWLSGLFSQ